MDCPLLDMSKVEKNTVIQTDIIKLDMKEHGSTRFHHPSLTDLTDKWHCHLTPKVLPSLPRSLHLGWANVGDL